ncbi:uncharacterized protein BDR25DRAFT_237792 [Lindgomyces ingoldianus]|uniref:Uncharacterized protein n=1 Tax=Lindgomyces ingoldianus TaxID=673940 RepID=A0ACB6QGH9_9PLEO|nr:uncharacterized protein BDR25DRAFT_237792 [Lindgomyces ingoldianus]KAF2466093.1 hypothetical protein BDR25DRAFT_237792 [Lindgomyces ingoldianus]
MVRSHGDGVDDGSGVNRTETKGLETRTGPTNSTKSAENANAAGKDEKKRSKVAELWGKMGLDVGTVLMMMKAAIPPTIALAMYQADSVAETYTTLGYLVAIISILGFCIMPRAKFIQTMALNVISCCIGAAVGLLMVWSGVQARLHTPGNPHPYNSSQSAVCGIWLFFQIWLVNSLKAKFPQFAFPTIIYAIFVNVAATYGPQFTTTAQAESFIKRLLESFLTGFGISTGVALFVIPVTCRKVVMKEFTGYITALRDGLQAHKAYLQSLETTDMFGYISNPVPDGKNKSKKSTKKVEVEALKKITSTITELHGKLHGDLPFAKREIAYGKLGPEDLGEIFKHLRAVMVPMAGLGSLVDIFGRFAEINGWDSESDSDNSDAEPDELRRKTVNDWNEIMRSVHKPFATIIQVMDQGLEHVLLRLQLVKPPKRKKGTNEADQEAKGDLVQPGDKGFADHLESQSSIFYQGKEITLRRWVERKGIKLAPDFFEYPGKSVYSEPEQIKMEPHRTHQRNQAQLYLLLYMEFLLYSISQAILAFVRFADEKDQEAAKSRLILPGKRRFRKWVANAFKVQDANSDDTTTVGGIDGNNTVIYMGEAYKARKDPEHLPPENAFEKAGNWIRVIPGFLRSPESAFGLRCACATMSIAIIAYLRDTQRFFIEQRLVWAMIMVAISMTPTSGQSVFSFILRIIGTIFAMIVAFLIWYIPDQKTAGVIAFLWFFVALGFYVPLKKPQFIIVGLISVVTATLIVGYELEVRKIGRQLATSNGQPYYAIYLLAPYRLATVVGGLAVAFIWTFFPYPISEHSALRQTLGGALYLSANFYSIVHEMVMARIRGEEGIASDDDTSPVAKLSKTRNKVFAKQMLLLQSLNTYSDFVKWEFPLGGKFPKKEYDTIIKCVSNIVQYTALLGYASQTFTDPSLNDEADPSGAQWFQDFRKIISSANITSHEITSMLALLSSSITNSQPLPPYLTAPQSYRLSQRLEGIDKDILSINHIAEPGYAAFAVIQISTRCINGDLEKLLKTVKKLVGELDFSFHITSTQNSSESSSAETLIKTLSRRSKQD